MIIVLTGAGISKESGISTFRDSDGLWEQERVEDVATPEGFLRNPNKVYNFYNKRRKELQSSTIKPNAAHIALANLENESSNPVLIITQNIDDLHERAGSKNLIHLHGELYKARCENCHAVFTWHNDFDSTTICPNCNKPGFMRPHIVWFGEMPFEIDKIEDALKRCSIFVSIGTSGNVYPAAGFSQLAKNYGAKTIELNLEPSANASSFDEAYHGPATKVVPTWVNKILNKS